MNLPGDEQGGRRSPRKVRLFMLIPLSITLFVMGVFLSIAMGLTSRDAELEIGAEATSTTAAIILPGGPPETPTPMATPGLVIYGQVHDISGAGIAGINIYRSYANTPGKVLAITNADGYYQTDFFPIPGDEMIMLYAELSGYRFDPEYYYWRHYHGYEITKHDFLAFTP